MSRQSTAHMFNPLWDSSQISVPPKAGRRLALTVPYRSASGTVSPERAATYLQPQGSMVYSEPEP